MKKFLVLISLVFSQFALGTVYVCTPTKEVYSSKMKINKMSFETKVSDGEEEIEMVTLVRTNGPMDVEVGNFKFEEKVVTVTVPGTDEPASSGKYLAKYVFQNHSNAIRKVNVVVKNRHLSHRNKISAFVFVISEDVIENANELVCFRK